LFRIEVFIERGIWTDAMPFGHPYFGFLNKKTLAHHAILKEYVGMKTTTLTETKAQKPTITKRPAAKRGQTELGWLHSRHTFSFGQYFDPDQMGFRSLRVINDDIVEAGQGFGTHPHRDAEIFSYVIEGELEHKDSLGNGSVIKPGDLQYISAGSGIKHSEFNPSKQNRVHFLQIWLMPNITGGTPRYAEKSLGKAAPPDALTLLFADEARDGAVAIRQDAQIYFGKLDKGRSLPARLAEGRHAWLHLIKGHIRVLDETLKEGDGAAVSNTTGFDILAEQGSEFLLFNLA
jgi:redox-sensitive bicupin YhaK (pirin superfamily)